MRNIILAAIVLISATPAHGQPVTKVTHPARITDPTQVANIRAAAVNAMLAAAQVRAEIKNAR